MVKIRYKLLSSLETCRRPLPPVVRRGLSTGLMQPFLVLVRTLNQLQFSDVRPVKTSFWTSPLLFLFLSLSAQSSGPLLSLHRVLHSGPPGRQTPPPAGSQVPPQVLLHGQWPQRPHDAWTLLLRYRQRRRTPRCHQEDWRNAAEKTQTARADTAQPICTELQEQL